MSKTFSPIVLEPNTILDAFLAHNARLFVDFSIKLFNATTKINLIEDPEYIGGGLFEFLLMLVRLWQSMGHLEEENHILRLYDSLVYELKFLKARSHMDDDLTIIIYSSIAVVLIEINEHIEKEIAEQFVNTRSASRMDEDTPLSQEYMMALEEVEEEIDLN